MVKSMNERFHRIANKVSSVTGSPGTFLLALFIVLVWALTGPMFDFSETWQLVINTGTTIITFLMVFLVQNTQNRDAKAMQLKLDELIRSSRAARDDFLGLENLNDDELKALDEQFKEIQAAQSESRLMKRLRAKLQSEHERRKQGGLKHQAIRAAGSVVNMLDPRSTNLKDE